MERASNGQTVIENMDFHGIQRYVFSTLRNEANAIMYYYLFPFPLSIDPEIHCVQKKNTHSHFLSYLHELFVDLNKNKIALNIPKD